MHPMKTHAVLLCYGHQFLVDPYNEFAYILQGFVSGTGIHQFIEAVLPFISHFGVWEVTEA